MNKLEKILKLTANKNRMITLTLNSDLVEMFKIAAEKNKISMTRLIESYIIEYLDANGLFK